MGGCCVSRDDEGGSLRSVTAVAPHGGRGQTRQAVAADDDRLTSSSPVISASAVAYATSAHGDLTTSPPAAVARAADLRMSVAAATTPSQRTAARHEAIRASPASRHSSTSGRTPRVHDWLNSTQYEVAARRVNSSIDLVLSQSDQRPTQLPPPAAAAAAVAIPVARESSSSVSVFSAPGATTAMVASLGAETGDVRVAVPHRRDDSDNSFR